MIILPSTKHVEIELKPTLVIDGITYNVEAMGENAKPPEGGQVIPLLIVRPHQDKRQTAQEKR